MTLAQKQLDILGQDLEDRAWREANRFPADGRMAILARHVSYFVFRTRKEMKQWVPPPSS